MQSSILRGVHGSENSHVCSCCNSYSHDNSQIFHTSQHFAGRGSNFFNEGEIEVLLVAIGVELQSRLVNCVVCMVMM